MIGPTPISSARPLRRISHQGFAIVKHIRCAVCLDPRRHDIESELADGARLRPSARKHGLSYDCLWRHWRRHVTPEQKDKLRFGDAPAHKLKGMVAEAEISVLKDLNFSRRSLIEALEATPAEDANARAALTGRLHENARIRGQISGELSKSSLITNNSLTVIMQSPALQEFLQGLAAKLRPFPDALRAVVVWLETREAQALEAVSSTAPTLEHVP
jgi:hypothetical protein